MKKSKTPVIAITGASGFVGSILVHYFLEKNWGVVALVRGADRKKKSATPGVEYREYDITQPVNKTVLNDVDYLVHAAFVKLDAKNPEAFDINVEGAKNLLSAAKQAQIQQSVFISTMSAHEEAISVYGKQKLAVEELFLKTKKSTILRCGLIIGKGGIVQEMAGFMQSKHAVPLIGGGLQPLQIISVYDLCEVIGNAIEHKVIGRFVAANPTVYTYSEFYKTLARHLNVRVAYIPLPYWLLQTVFKMATTLHIPLGVGEDNLKGLKKLKAMPSAEDMKTLHVKPLDLKAALEKAKL